MRTSHPTPARAWGTNRNTQPRLTSGPPHPNAGSPGSQPSGSGSADGARVSHVNVRKSSLTPHPPARPRRSAARFRGSKRSGAGGKAGFRHGKWQPIVSLFLAMACVRRQAKCALRVARRGLDGQKPRSEADLPAIWAGVNKTVSFLICAHWGESGLAPKLRFRLRLGWQGHEISAHIGVPKISL